MQAIYSYISGTNNVCRVYNFAAILFLQIMVYVMLFQMMNVLYFTISAFRSMCAVTSKAVLYSSLMLFLPGALLRYFLNNFDFTPVAPIITGINFVFNFT
jgi:hypothetical protein